MRSQLATRSSTSSAPRPAGFSFMLRLKDLKDQQLYRIERASSHGVVDGLYRGTVDTSLIREQYDALVCVASLLRNRTAPAHVVLERLAASSDRLARALTMLGRVVKTTYILRYLQDAAIRDRVQLQLNRGETRHELARRLFFAYRKLPGGCSQDPGLATARRR